LLICADRRADYAQKEQGAGERGQNFPADSLPGPQNHAAQASSALTPEDRMNNLTFDEMHLLPQLLTAVKACGYSEPTPIQREAIPPLLEGHDLLGCAQTGTGKTAAFALPILQLLNANRPGDKAKRPIRALILTPTRELALQIQENFVAYGKKLALRSCVIFGGVGQQPQVDQLKRGVDILVATPGRLNDLIGQGYISLAQLNIFVLDEADRMLDMGFIHDVRKVIALLPQKRQTLLFSATMPAEVEKLALSILREPVTVKVDPVSSTVDTIQQSLYMVDKPNKKRLLAHLLAQPEVESALVFTRTKHGADRVVRELSRAGIQARAIHGDKSQNARQEALSSFKTGKIRVLIATDIAARGIDIAGLSHVFNYDLPNEPESYVHRIGRTGRAGHEGVAVSFCCIDEMKCLRDIEKLIGKKLPRLESQWPMEVFTETVKQPKPSRAERPLQQSGRKQQGKPAREEKAPQARPQKETKESVSQKEKPAVKVKNNLAAASPVKKTRENKLQNATGDNRETKRNKDKKPEAAQPDVARKAGKRNRLPEMEKKPVPEKKQPPKTAQKTEKTHAALPEMRSTPLDRPVSHKAAQNPFLLFMEDEKPERKRPEPEEPSMSYEEFMKQQSKQPSRLFTGSDRR